MLVIIGIVVFVLVAAYILFRKPKDKDDGYGEYSGNEGMTLSNESFFDKVKVACCTRGR